MQEGNHMFDKAKKGILAIAVLVVIIIALIIMQSFKKMESANETIETQPYTSGNPQGPTIESLAARLENRSTREAEIEQELDKLKQTNTEQLNKFSQSIDDKFEKQSEAQATALAEALENIKTVLSQQYTIQTNDNNNDYDINGRDKSNNNFVWISNSAPTSIAKQNHEDEYSDDWGEFKTESNTVSSNNNDNRKVINTPYLTINKNATLMDATLMGPLIGRIPVDGHIDDPYPFKVILGKENLATNGFDIPGLEGIVASGFAKGDMALSCARGEVTSLTFIFPDGTISTSSSETAELSELRNASTLGYIANNRGNPCIRGEFKTNASKYLADRMLMSGIEGAGDAFSSAQTTTDTNSDGSHSSFLTGSMGKFIGGQVASNSAHEASDWLRARQANSFDVVYVPTGQDIVVNITKEIHIDKDSNARKISYVQDKKHTVAHLD